MKRKDYEPINFKFFQSDMEKMLFFINEAIIICGQSNTKTARTLSNIKEDIERKIVIHRRNGDWK